MTTQRVTIIGPNLPRPLCDKGTFHVHAEGCADIKRYPQPRDPDWTIEASSIATVVEDIYSDILAENDIDGPDHPAWPIYESDVHFAPCVKLPRKDEV
jgi:hypothetical protein